jgi:hypothetical protein
VDSVSGVNPYGLFTREAEVIAGQPVSISATALAELGAASATNVRGDSILNFEDGGIFWGGIASVSLLDGTSVDYTVTSGSGTDYRVSLAPIPEPSTWALLLAGIGVLAVVQARSRNQGD